MARRKQSRPQRAKTAALKVYKEHAVKLRKFGFPVKFGTSARGSKKPSEKAKVTKLWNKVKIFTDNKKQKFVFRKAAGKKRRVLEAGLSDKQFTPAGYFLRVPKGSKRAPRTKIDTKREIITYDYEGLKGGKLREEIHRIDPELLMEDPPRAILALGGKKDKVVLTVNGFDSSTTREYSLDALAFYIAEDLLPKFLDPNIRKNDPGYARLHGKGPRDVSDFVDIFHVKILRYEKPPRRKKRKVSRQRKKAVQPRKRSR